MTDKFWWLPAKRNCEENKKKKQQQIQLSWFLICPLPLIFEAGQKFTRFELRSQKTRTQLKDNK